MVVDDVVGGYLLLAHSVYSKQTNL